jgi:sodium-coupled neutral amino acid transporter 7/8
MGDSIGVIDAKIEDCRNDEATNQHESKARPVSSKSLRSWFVAGSVGSAVMTLAKGTLGAGILALPKKTMLGGIPVFLVLIAISGYFTSRSIVMIAKASQITGKYVFEEITEKLLGKGMAILLGVSMLLNCYGASIVYVIAIKDAFESLLPDVTNNTGQPWATYATLILGACVLVPLSVLERLNSLRILSLAGVVGVFFTVGSIIYALAYLGISPSLSSTDSLAHNILTPKGGFIDMMTVISTLTFAFCNQFNIPQMYGELADKRSKSVSVISYVSTLLPMILYIVAAVTGYLCYGMEIDGNILNNFAPLVSAGKIIVFIGIAAVILSVSLCHLLNNFPMRLSVIFFLPESFHENKWVRYGVPLFTAVSTIAIAIGYANLSAFLGLVGATTGSIICYIVPALFSIKVREIRKQEETGTIGKKNSVVKRAILSLKDHPEEWIMVLVGVLIGVVGTFSEFYACFN